MGHGIQLRLVSLPSGRRADLCSSGIRQTEPNAQPLVHRDAVQHTEKRCHRAVLILRPAYDDVVSAEVPDDSHTTSQREAGARTPPSAEKHERRRSSDASVPAIVATVALVVFAIFIGVYGPRIGNRQQMPGGTTLLELASALGSRHANEVVGALQLFRDEPIGRDAVLRDMRAILGQVVGLPELAESDVAWLRATSIRGPGAGGAQVFLRLGTGFSAEYASIFLLIDEDRFTVFDGYGRPLAMPEGEVFAIPLSGDSADALLYLFRTGDIICGVQASRVETSDLLVARMQSSLAKGLVGASDETVMNPVDRDVKSSAPD
jgi:hypothetical protein